MLVDEDNFRRTLRLELGKSCKQNVLDTIRLLERREDVLYVGPDYFVSHISSNSITAATDEISNLFDPWWADRMMLPEVWDVAAGSRTVKVGIMDMGIDKDHPALTGIVNAELSRDFFQTNDPFDDPFDDLIGHGTAVAGVVGEAIGTSQNISLVSLKVADGSEGHGLFSRVIEAINHATANEIEILNMSFYWETDDPAAFNAIENFPGLIVCGAGNEAKNNDNMNEHYYPAKYDLPNLITVGATCSKDDRWIRSNFGEKTVDVFAPGTHIISPYPMFFCNTGDCYEMPSAHITQGYHAESGTSLASPMVAGVAALIKSMRSDLSAAEVKEAIMENVDEIPELDGLSVTGGRVNALKAVSSVIFQTNPTGYSQLEISGFNPNFTLQPNSILTLPDRIDGHDVISIGDWAFADQQNLVGIVMSEKIASIGDFAFYGSGGLRTITVLGEAPQVGANTFAGVSKSNIQLQIPFGAMWEYGGDWAGFVMTEGYITRLLNATEVEITGVNGVLSGVVEIPSDINNRTVTYIGRKAFANQEDITEIVVPSTVVSIGEGAFWNTEAVAAEIGGGVAVIGDWAFGLNVGLAEVVIRDGVGTIGMGAFAYCVSLTEVVIPGSVEDIGALAFFECFDLTDVVISYGVKSIGDAAFAHSGLVDVIVPFSVEIIEMRAFASCASLESIRIPDSVNKIGAFAFEESIYLTVFTNLSECNVPSGWHSFWNRLCSLERIHDRVSVVWDWSGCPGCSRWDCVRCNICGECDCCENPDCYARCACTGCVLCDCGVWNCLTCTEFDCEWDCCVWCHSCDDCHAKVFVINDVADLLAFAEAVNSCQNGFSEVNVFLTADIDLDNDYWTPIGVLCENYIGFQGIFDGGDNTVSNFKLCGSHRSVGFFGLISFDGVVKDLNLEGVVIEGDMEAFYDNFIGIFIGTLAGANLGSIIDCRVSGSISITIDSISCDCVTNSYCYCFQSWQDLSIGGMVGANAGLIVRSHASVDIEVSSVASNISWRVLAHVGGLVGTNMDMSYIIDSSAFGDVSVEMVSEYYDCECAYCFRCWHKPIRYEVHAGGLAGSNYGMINGGHAEGNVFAKVLSYDGYSNVVVNAGGLVGQNMWVVANSLASGTVEALGGSENLAVVYAGGLVGLIQGDQWSNVGITHSYATGDVYADYEFGNVTTAAGGLVGINIYAGIFYSWASGNVFSEGSYQYAAAGGLVGINLGGESIGGEIINSFGRGDAEAIGHNYAITVAGGLVGQNNGQIINCYASGQASAESEHRANAGGLVGVNGTWHGQILNSYTTADAALTGRNYGFIWNSHYGMPKSEFSGYFFITVLGWDCSVWDLPQGADTNRHPKLLPAVWSADSSDRISADTNNNAGRDDRSSLLSFSSRQSQDERSVLDLRALLYAD
jgi:hypothetical protein